MILKHKKQCRKKVNFMLMRDLISATISPISASSYFSLFAKNLRAEFLRTEYHPFPDFRHHLSLSPFHNILQPFSWWQE